MTTLSQHIARVQVANISRRDKDPTMTLTLRNQFCSQMNKRFRALKGVIRKSIIDNDCFDLKPREVVTLAENLDPVPRRAFRYSKDDEKIAGFMEWLQGEEEKGILEITRGPSILDRRDTPWTNVYIQSAYQKGLAEARQDLIAGGVDVIPAYTDETLGAAFYQPFHADRVALIYTRAFNELKGVTEAMNSQISRELANGMARGDGPYRIAQKLNDRVDKVGIVRARLIARTEIVYTHNSAALNEMEALEGIVGEDVKVKWWTALDERVRSTHAARHGKVYTRKEGNELIGEPNCRCALRPWLDSWGEEEASVGTRFVSPPDAGKPQPMSSIGRFGHCILRSIGNFFNKTVDTPDACRDYTRGSDGNWYLNGEAVAEEVVEKLKKMRIPPAWRNVVVAVNPELKVQAIGQDAAGRWQYRYSQKHIQAAARKKFDRVKDFSRDMPTIRKKMEDGISAGDQRALLLKLEDKTAIRAGSRTDFKAKKKAYGLTTLKSKHAKIDGDKITLSFTAKEGLPARYTLRDDVLAEWIEGRKKGLKPNDDLFPDIPASKLNDYIKELANGKKYSLKDYRTYHGTRIAYNELKKYGGKTLTEAKKKKIVRDVSIKASKFLHNTPVMAKNSYIDPVVWDFIGGLP